MSALRFHPTTIHCCHNLFAVRVISITWMSAIIDAVDLRKNYRVGKIEVPALRSISFFVEKREFVSVLGPSGSGKCTLYYLQGGLTQPESSHDNNGGDD